MLKLTSQAEYELRMLKWFEPRAEEGSIRSTSAQLSLERMSLEFWEMVFRKIQAASKQMVTNEAANGEMKVHSRI